MLVLYKDRVRGFLEKHGNDALKAMYDPEYRNIVADFYRLTINLKMLNSVTVANSQPMLLCKVFQMNSSDVRIFQELI